MKRYHDLLPRYVKVPLPDGTVRVMTETSYKALTKSLASLALALERAEYVDGPAELRLAHNVPQPWKKLLVDTRIGDRRALAEKGSK